MACSQRRRELGPFDQDLTIVTCALDEDHLFPNRHSHLALYHQPSSQHQQGSAGVVAAAVAVVLLVAVVMDPVPCMLL